VPVIFVHGVPDTTRVWDKVRSRLARRDVIAIELPGFGTPRPAAFQPTKDGYVDWLLSRLAREPKPVDIVGHDWGALLVLRAISLRPELARTWVVGAAPLDPDYEWHKAAKLWQTPEVGERVMEATTPEALAAALTAAGVPADDAAITTKHFDATMKACILALYRSAVHVGSEWVEDLARIKSPGLVLWGENDPYAASRFGSRLAERTGARFVALPGCSHWWQLERPDEVARHLEVLWASAP